ncbi:unnamed protein product [Nesidiocoris tenuis]|uniref:Uncharacterized protein n=1 Tax=Nesidiocoris tenuis TaxID=355587 RepID=A0A6H5GKV6_9HEMI|nr:unnamed protein product [Nesidiocoris tenuis]
MDTVDLNETECHFNWKLRHYPCYKECAALEEKFRMKLSPRDPDPNSYDPKWALRLSLAYELFHLGRKNDALEQGELAISELAGMDYLSSCEHILYSVLAIMRKDMGIDIQPMVERITPLRRMNDLEKAGVFGNQAVILRIYGPQEAVKGIKVLRSAIRLDPNQREWKISLLSLSRNRNHWKNRNRKLGSRNTLESMAEELQLIDNLMSIYPIGSDVLYYDARAFADLAASENVQEKADGHRERVTCDCRRIVDLGTTSPPVIAFCSEWFCSLPSSDDRELGCRMLLEGFERLPKNKHFIKAGRQLLRLNLPQSRKEDLRSFL